MKQVAQSMFDLLQFFDTTMVVWIQSDHSVFKHWSEQRHVGGPKDLIYSKTVYKVFAGSFVDCGAVVEVLP